MCIFLDLVDLLLKHGADPDYFGTTTESPLRFCHYFLDSSRDESAFPLMIAVRRGALSCAELLLNAGARINQTNAIGQTALHALCYYWFQMKDEKLIQLLLKHKADVYIKDVCGRTALHYACDRQWKCEVDILLGAGAQLNIMDDSGLTELHLAALSEHDPDLKVQRLLESCQYSIENVIEIYETVPSYFLWKHIVFRENTLEQAFDYMKKATLMRKEYDLHKTVSEPLECYDFAKEWETMEDLLRYKNSSRDLMVQATLSRERNNKGRYGLSSLRKSLDIYSKYRNCFISSFQGPF